MTVTNDEIKKHVRREQYLQIREMSFSEAARWCAGVPIETAALLTGAEVATLREFETRLGFAAFSKSPKLAKLVERTYAEWAYSLLDASGRIHRILMHEAFECWRIAERLARSMGGGDDDEDANEIAREREDREEELGSTDDAALLQQWLGSTDGRRRSCVYQLLHGSVGNAMS